MGEIKQERVREKVKFETARIIQTKLRDPRAGFITVQNVELSRDFRNAKIFVSILGSDADKRKVMRMLDGATGYIQREVAGTLKTRVTPALKFVIDESIDKSFRVAEILDQIKKDSPATLEQSDGLNSDPELEPAEKKPKKKMGAKERAKAKAQGDDEDDEEEVADDAEGNDAEEEDEDEDDEEWDDSDESDAGDED